MVKGISMLANYTYAKTMDEQSSLNDSTNAISSSTPNPDNLAFQYGPANQDTRHIFNLGFRANLPTFRSAPGPLRAIIDNWAVNGIYNARTGHPVNITFGGDERGNDEGSQRAQLIAGMNPNLPGNRHRVDKITSWFNPLAFQKPAAGTWSTTKRNSITGPAYICTTLSLTKSIQMQHVRKGMRAQFRAEAYNVFNTINLGQPRSNYSATAAQASTFGSINSGGTNPNRRIQFGFILYF
jgi:hypothetical protein